MKVSTLVVGLNPALQRRLVLPGSLTPGDVHRITAVQTGIGGKGQDVAVALSCLASNGGGGGNGGGDNDNDDSNTNQQQLQQLPRLLQFLGQGASGDTLMGQLDPHVDRVSSLTIRTASPLRVCTSLVAPDSTTELVEPSGRIASAEMQELWHRLEQESSSSSSPSWDGCAFMGSLPPDCPSDIYAQLYDKLTPGLCVVDSLVGLPALLETIHQKQQQKQQSSSSSSSSSSKDSTSHGSVVLKINVDELCALVGLSKEEEEQKQQGDVDDTDVTVFQAVSMFLDQFDKAATSLTAVALTNGPDPAYVASFPDQTLYKVPVPQLQTTTTTLYPIGAGDAVAAGTLAAWQTLEQDASWVLPDTLRQLLLLSKQQEGPSVPSLVTAVSFGLACGTASCLQEENSVLDVCDVASLFGRVGAPTRVHDDS
mmetsp:Transcript_17936/g.33890  ORF Transcript_17936/g.33890 Transcript_17936/m.33890 type:complete len:425 (+) Transcript_17936:1-1275(+)|eukprot:scaffold5885_cov201-Amphora_coffeaeformis.AAC.8